MAIPEPQRDIYCVVNRSGEVRTRASSGRWSFRTLEAALLRRNVDRQYWGHPDPSESRVARYVFDGWAD